MSLSIRPASAADAAVILEFIQALADYERLRAEAMVTEDQLRATLFGERPYAEVLLAEWESAPAGFALFFHNYSTFLGQPGLYLEDLFVRPELRHRGIGRALLTELARIALTRGCGRLEWAVLNWNSPALMFYERLGARPLADWTIYRLSGEALQRLGRGAAG